METKKKRGRPKKVQLPEEIQEIIKEIPITNHQESIVKEEHKDNKNLIWDFQIGNDIEIFDSTMSYEITGYRPIDQTRGLDFDPKWFVESRDTYNRTGHYTDYRYGTKAYKNFWD